MVGRWFRRGWPGPILFCGLLLTGCEQPTALVAASAPPPVEAAPVNGIGYIVFTDSINPTSSALLVQDMDALAAKGATTIDLGLNSPGGNVESAEAVVREMTRLHADHGVTFKVWNLKIVASAATLIFLDAQQRYTQPRAGFLFHGPQLVAIGTFNAETLRRDADRIDQVTRELQDSIVAHTRLNRQEAQIYTTRTVILSADDALADGVVDSIGGLAIPKGTTLFVIKGKPAPVKPPAPIQNAG